MIAATLKTRVEQGMRSVLARLHLDMAAAEHSRWFLLGATVLAWVVLCSYLTIRVSAARTQHQALQAEVGRLRQLVGDTSWQARLQQSEALKFQLNQRLWTAATPGLAQAQFEKWISDHIARHGLEKPAPVRIERSSVTTQSAGGSRTPGLEKMTAKVITSYNAAGVVALVAEMTASDKIIVIDQLKLWSRTSRIEMNVSTFVQLAEESKR